MSCGPYASVSQLRNSNVVIQVLQCASPAPFVAVQSQAAYCYHAVLHCYTNELATMRSPPHDQLDAPYLCFKVGGNIVADPGLLYLDSSSSTKLAHNERYVSTALVMRAVV